MHYGDERVRQIQQGCERVLIKAVHCLGIMIVAGVLAGGTGTAWAVPKETSTEKAERLRQQANPQLFNDWTFDKDEVGSVPKGFAAVASGDQQGGSWRVEAQSAVPSAPNVLLGTSGCAGCNDILVAQGFQYEYPDLWCAFSSRRAMPGRSVWCSV